MSKTTPDTLLEPIHTLNEQAVSIELSDFKAAIKLYTEAFVQITLLKEVKDTAEYKRLYLALIRNLSIAHFRSSNYKQSLRYAVLLLEEAKYYQYKNAESDAYILLGNNYSDKSKFLESLSYYGKALKILHETNHREGEANCYNNIANIYLYQKKYKEALPYYKKALEIFLELKRFINACVAINNIVIIKIEQNDLESALEYLKQSEIFSKQEKNLFSLAQIDFYHGQILSLRKKYDEALVHFEKAYKEQTKLDDKSGLFATAGGIGLNLLNKYKSLKEKDETLLVNAEKYYLMSMELSEKIDSRYAIHLVCKSLWEYYEFMGNIPKAFEYYKKHTDIGKEIFGDELTEQIDSLKSELEEKDEQHIKDLNQLKYVELAETVRRMEELDKQKNEFFGIVVHDIKNPVGSIKMMGELLLHDDLLKEEERKEFLVNIVNSADKALELVLQLLDYNVIENGEIKLKPADLDLNAVVEKIIKLYSINGSRKSIKINYKNSLKNSIFKMDKNAFEQIVDNLFSNAIKFSPEEKNIYISLSNELTDDNKFLKIEIKDEGPGFSNDDRKKLFKQFSKLSARPTGGEHSSGLGLSIVKKLVDSLKGTIECESEKGKGANMIVRIPIESR